MIGAAIALGVYVLAMLVVAVLARRARRDNSLSDFYLASRGLGMFVLLATMYATQYSGNTLLGYPGEAHRLGFAWVMSVGFMTAVIAVYLLFIPQLYVHAQRYRYVTPGDWIQHRFGSRALTVSSNVLTVVAICNYLLAQLMAMGHIVAGFTGGAVPYWFGVVLLTLVVLMYETAGGMRAVAWTDAIQGLLLVGGLAGIMIAVVPTPSHLAEVTAWIAERQPEKVAVPSWTGSANWLSTLLLVGFSAAVYPQAIQRVYAARSLRALRWSLGVMAFMPLVTIVPVFLIGILSIQRLGGLDGVAADQVMPMLMAGWAAESPGMYALALVVMLGAVAAIMSTADSVLLTLSSILAKDLIGPWLFTGAPEERLTRVGKVASWVVVAVLIAIALVPRITLWGLLELKMELLLQVSPLFVLGLTWRRLTARAAFAGMLTGLALALGIPLAGYARPFGFHAGVIGWAANLLVCYGLSMIPSDPGSGADSAGCTAARRASSPGAWPSRGKTPPSRRGWSRSPARCSRAA